MELTLPTSLAVSNGVIVVAAGGLGKSAVVEPGWNVSVPRMERSSNSATCRCVTGESGQEFPPPQPTVIWSRANCSIQGQAASLGGTSVNIEVQAGSVNMSP